MVEITGLVKTYRRWGRSGHAVQAIAGLDLSLPPGTATGLVGVNGAGKSTLLKLVLGFTRPTAGTVSIDGLPARTYAERFGIGYVPERPSIPPAWTVEEALRAFAMFGEVPGDAWKRVGEIMARMRLVPMAAVRVGTLSKGNLQRLAIAQALLGERKLWVLDEPTDGLDPIWIAELRTIIREWREADPGRILILASHNLVEVGRCTDRVLLLHNGRLAGELGTDDPASIEDEFLARLGSLEEARV